MFYQGADLADLSRGRRSKKILITGASGFIGSHLVEEGLRRGYTVYAGVRPGSKRDFLQQDGLRFFQLDLTSPQLMERRFKHFLRSEGGFDYIVHNAGITRAHRKEDFQLVNDGYTRHLVNAVSEAGRLPEKFVFISSLAAGGPGDPLHLEPIRLSDPDHPLSAYAKSKLSAERYIRSIPDFPYIILRPTAVYGPRDKDFLSLFRLVNLGIEPLVGWYPQKLSFIYVKDLARIVVQLLGAGCARTSWLISDGVAYNKEDAGNILRTILNRETIKVSLPLAPIRAVTFCIEKTYSLFGRMPFLHLDKLKEMAAPNWLCDSQTIWKEMGIKPLYTLESGLREAADWYDHNGWLHWYRGDPAQTSFNNLSRKKIKSK